MMLEGVNWITPFRRTSLPTFDRNFLFPSLILFHTLFSMKLKSTALFLPITMGNPRYLSTCVLLVTSSKAHNLLRKGPG